MPRRKTIPAPQSSPLATRLDSIAEVFGELAHRLRTNEIGGWQLKALDRRTARILPDLAKMATDAGLRVTVEGAA